MSEMREDPNDSSARQSDTLPYLLAIFARAEFKAPVDAIAGLVRLLFEDCGIGLPASCAADIEKMQTAVGRLESIVSALLDPASAHQARESDPETFASTLRHDLRTPITAILGYGELLAEEAEGIDLRSGILADILSAARRLLGQIDAMATFIRSEGHEPRTIDAAGLHTHRHLAASIKTIGLVLLGSAEPPPRASGRILVIDDNTSTLDLLTRLLTREGHRVTTESSGEAALDGLDPEQFDLILLDLLMPGLSGIDVLARLKLNPDTAALPVIMISALDEIEGTARCIEAGADDYLTKPVDATLLRARIGATLERKFLRDREQAVTRQLLAEQARSESLLRNVLPASVVARLRAGETIIADRFAEATILFSDLVGFTALTATLPPDRVLDLLNRIFSAFDRLAADHGLEKIKTIGDAYMVAGGLPEPRRDHASAVAAMALEMPRIVETISRDLGRPLAIRIGLHSGPVAAGIIGTDKFIYDVWGDTVNLASRMERHGEPGRVHVSADTLAALGSSQAAEAREPIDVKGRGRMATFFLLGNVR